MSLLKEPEIKELCIWNKLKNESRPVLLYGTGNGADKILKVCEDFGITISGIFASGGFVRDRFFHEYKVKSFEDCETEFGNDFVVLLAFGTTLPEVRNNINNISKKHELYAPSVPLFGEGLFDDKFCINNIDKMEEVYNLLEDEKSKEIFLNLIKFRLSGDLSYIEETEEPAETYKSVLSDKEISTVIDCGAYRGDSARDIIDALSPQLIYAIEPDRRTFSKLSIYAEEETRASIKPIHAAVSNRNDKINIKSTAGRSSGISSITYGAKTEEVDLITVDSLLNGSSIDLIKYDVEGDEWEAIRGSMETIKEGSPCLSVSIYHRNADLFLLPLFIHELMPKSQLYIRRAPCIPDWDILLIAKTP